MRWFRRRLAPSDIAIVEVDGVRYDARAMYRPQTGRGQWQRFAERVRRAYGAAIGRDVEGRAINSVPWSRGDALTPTSASQGRALQLGAVWSAIRLICDTVSTLPVKSYRKVGETRTPTSLPTLFRQLDDDGTLVPWLWRCVSSLMLRGNAYGLITSRDGMQFPTVIQWLDPDEVSCDDTNPWAPIWYWRGQAVATRDFVHIPWFVVAGTVQGLSPIEAYAMSVSTGLQAQEYGATWFANGGVPPGTMKNTRQTIDRTQADAISDRLVSAIKRRRPIVYGADWDYNAVSVPPEQAQFLETIQASASQIASIYGLPPEYVGGTSGDSLTYSTVEQNAIRLNQALRPLLVRLENVFSALLPNKQRVKFNADATARADLKTRYEAYEIAQRIGLLTADEMRAMEDLAPLPPGSKPATAPRPVDRRHLPGLHNQKSHGHGGGLSGLKGQAALDAVPASLTPAPNGHTQNYTGEKLDAPTGAGSVRALSEYEGVEYQTTNTFLRGGYKDPKTGVPATGDESFLEGVRERVAEIDKTMSVSPLDDDVVTYRAIKDGKTVFGDEWYRGVIDWDADFDTQDAQMEEWEAGKRPNLTGLRWAERGYSSTTVNPERPAAFGRRWPAANSALDGEPVIMTIHVPKGTGAVQLSGMDTEAEILLQRDLVMEIAADHGVTDGFRRLDVTVVSDA